MNRNFGFMWDPYEWNSGPAPHSEPETQALTGSWAGAQPYMAALSAHSGTVVFLYPWGYRGGNPADGAEFAYLAGQYIYPNYCTDLNMDTAGTCFGVLYQAVGVSNDEQYGAHGMLGFTPEVSYTKECSFATSQQVFVDHQPAIQWLIEQMDEGLHGFVKDAGTSDPIGALIEVEGKWMTFSDYEVGDYHKYLRAGTYDVRVSANGYEPQTATITITDGTPSQRDFLLTAAAEPETFAWRWLISDMPNYYESTHTASDAFGPPDSDYISIGFGGEVVLDLGPDGISDSAGTDLMVYEAGSDGDESFTLAGCIDSPHGPWTALGPGSGTTAFDLNGTGLATVRYVKITDAAEFADGAKASDDGYDLDAIGSPAFVASFTATPTTGEPPLTVTFGDRSTGTPTVWEWDFGDGESSTVQNPVHEYDEIGTYDVTLTVTGAEGTRTLTKMNYIEVTYAPPVASFTAAPTVGQVPLTVNFTNSSTGTIAEYAWTFGDGGTSAEENPSHVYEAPGRYSVELTITGPGGEDSQYRWRLVRTTCGPPVADFEADVTTGPTPLDVQFGNLTQAADACPATYAWQFGDGATSTEEEPAHSYTTPGSYTVTLTATSEGGNDTEAKNAYIVVTEPGDDDDDDDTTPGDDDTTPADDDDDDDNDDNDDDNGDDDDDTGPVEGDDDDDDNDSGCGC